jgi:hypothetical protein
MSEDRLVAAAHRVLARSLPRRFNVQRGAPLLYQVQVDNRLDFTVKASAPTRGQSAFQTDLCVFERVAANTRIPRVVLEFKTGLSTHDILTYSTKARRHKQVYPYLRYGIVAAREPRVTAKFFNHNEALDFVIAAGSLSASRFAGLLRSLIRKEVSASRRLERMAFDSSNAVVYRNEVTVRES